MSDAASALEVRALNFRYSPHTLNGQAPWKLRAGHLRFQSGACYNIVGDNMSGKSTLIGVLAGSLGHDHPQVCDGTLSSPFGTLSFPIRVEQARAFGVGVVFQNDAMFPDLSIWTNVRLGAPAGMWSGPNSGNAHKVTEELLCRSLGLRRVPLDQPLSVLSGGGRSLVRLLRAVVWPRTIIFMDEPTAGLDKGNQQRFWEVLERCVETQTSLALVSHLEQDREHFQNVAAARRSPCSDVVLIDGTATQEGVS